MKRREFFKSVTELSLLTSSVVKKGNLLEGTEPQKGNRQIFLQREGNLLTLKGQPFRSLGVNKHEIFAAYYLADFFGGNLNRAVKDVLRSLDNLAETGLTIVRFHALPYWSAQIEDTYLKHRETFWQRFERMVRDCRERSIRLVPVLLWNIGAFVDIVGESLQDFANNPNSKSRNMFNAWVEDIVTRYKDDPTILFWEVTNEANLTVDLRPQLPKGVVPPTDLTKPYKHLTRNPGPRDWRNHWTADEMAAFVRETAFLIKSLDKNHLVAAGYSLPRPSAWHLWLGSLKRARKMDWTKDSDEEHANYIRMVHPEPLDFIDCHFYLGSQTTFDQLVLLKKVADDLDKPVYVGEVGVSSDLLGKDGYSSPIGLHGLKISLDALEALNVPLVLLWSWEDECSPTHEPVIRFSEHKEILKLLSETQKRWKQNLKPTRKGIHSDVEERLRALVQNWQELVSGQNR